MKGKATTFKKTRNFQFSVATVYGLGRAENPDITDTGSSPKEKVYFKNKNKNRFVSLRV